MNPKIGWYREVLELEPDSRLFHPLAHLLVEEGNLEEACEVLRKGLVRHPAFLEARLLLVEVLRRLDRRSEVEDEIRVLAPVFERHADFWRAWAASVTDHAGVDTDLVLRFTALALQGVRVDFADVLRRGLESLEAEVGAARATAPASAEKASAGKLPTGSGKPSARATAPVATHLTPSATAGLEIEEKGAPQETAAGPSPTPASAVKLAPTTMENLAAAAAGAVLRAAAPEEAAGSPSDAVSEASDAGSETDTADGSMTWPPRTRSMAEVLAEQGDFVQAREIYLELAARAKDPVTRGELEECARAMHNRMTHAPEGEGAADAKEAAAADAAEAADAAAASERASAGTVAPDRAAADGESATESAPAEAGSASDSAYASSEHGLRSMLEALAERMEARAR